VIINGDTRSRVIDLAVRPHSATCLIQTRYTAYPNVLGIGTGFLVGQGRLATAAHVLWNDVDGRTKGKRRLPDVVEIYLGQGVIAGHPELAWTLTPTADDNPVHPEYIAGDKAHDVAKLQLPVTPAAPLGIIGFPSDLKAGEAVTVGGFPTDRKPFGHYEGTGPLGSLAEPVFQHQADAEHGQSGAPVRIQRNGGWTVIGIHVGDHDEPGPGGAPMNRAIALTPPLVSWLLA
jgi:V8-like Glu-specific endopeptidase